MQQQQHFVRQKQLTLLLLPLAGAAQFAIRIQTSSAAHPELPAAVAAAALILTALQVPLCA
jgi:hypothetical protein